ncbi:MAG: DUF192 domain-containing protein [Thermoproteus sp.]
MAYRLALAAAVAIVAALIAALALSNRGAAQDDPFAETAEVLLDGRPYVVYLADTPAKWVRGYMNATSYDPRGVGAIGMLFLFDKNATWCFWMHDTPIWLKIIWVQGTEVTKAAIANPFNDTAVCGYGDKALEVDPEIPTPTHVSLRLTETGGR